MLFSIIHNSFTPHVPNTATTGSVWCSVRFTFSSEKEERKHVFNHVQYNMDFLKHGFSQTFKGSSLFRYRGNEMCHFKALLQCNTIKQTNTANHNHCSYNLAFCDLPSGSLLLSITSKEETSVSFTWGHSGNPNKIHSVNPNRTDNYFKSPSFFTPCTHCAIFNVKSQIIFLF